LINAAGPWIDRSINRWGSRKSTSRHQGSHLVVDNPELRKAIGTDESSLRIKRRIVLIFPFYDKVIVGTSDLPIDDPDSARCTPEEEQYFIDLVARVFPAIPIKREQLSSASLECVRWNFHMPRRQGRSHEITVSKKIWLENCRS
jgi:glycerol-3-phosphate dehydrogenase